MTRNITKPIKIYTQNSLVNFPIIILEVCEGFHLADLNLIAA